MKIAAVQLNPTVGDCEGNARQIMAAMTWAKQQGADLVVCPELAVTGYPPRDLLERPAFIDRNLCALEAIVRASAGIAVVVGYVARNPNATGRALMNAAAFIHDGQLVASQAKTLLPTYDVFDEHRYFEPATEYQIIPFAGLRLGLSICEDGWAAHEVPTGRRIYAQDPMERLAHAGANLVINISASPFAVGKLATRQRLCQQAVQRFGYPILYVNMVGGNDQLVFDGGSFLLGRAGDVVWSMPRFAPAEAILDTALCDAAPLLLTPCSAMEEVAQALVLGLRDYLRKCGFTSVLIGLSGGIDSAVVAALAVEALGAAAVTGVAMPSPYSSPESVEDAEALARNLHMPFRVLPITPMYDVFRRTLHGDSASAPLDVADENLQARIRGTMLMTLSNRTGAMVLSTGNKSELAVGYCTLYGDMAGGLALISDVPKTMVYDLAHWLNRKRTIIPERTLTKAPSAELRPGQTDQDALPPYPILDQILKQYIELHHSPEQIIAAGYDSTIVRDVVRRIDHNEYKRRQAPPGIQISEKAFGIGRRLPIAARYA